MAGFTSTGQPIQGRRYTIIQGDLVIPVTVVGKVYGKGGGADLTFILLEGPTGGREMFTWPIEAAEGADEIRFGAGWEE